MARNKFIARSLGDASGQPFDNAQEAWFWYSHCQLARIEGARFGGGRTEGRPCDPDDIYRAVNGLYRRRILDGGHLKVLARFGRRLAPPNPIDGDRPGDAVLWDEALDRLTTVLRAKGIVS